MNARSERIAYFDGRLGPVSEVRVPADDRAVLFGLGFFETFRTSGGRPHLWRLHQRRLLRACETAGLALPPAFLGRDVGRLGNVVRELLAASHETDAVFRYTVTGGGETDARGPLEILVPRSLPAPAPDEGASLRVLRLARDNGEWIPRPKSLNYSNALLGRDELRARATDASDEGLFLSREGGFVVETTHQNLAWVRGHTLFHPEPSLGCIDGTCLAWLAESTDVRACRATLLEMLDADAIVVVNAVRGVTPIRRVCGRDDEVLTDGIGSAAHPLVRELQRKWAAALAATALDS